MKKPNKHVTRLVVWTVSGSLLASSCVNIVQEPMSYPAKQELSDMGEPAIQVHLSDEQSEYFNEVTVLAQRIIHDRAFAKEFNANPTRFLKSRSSEFDGEAVIPDDALMRITTALADDEIAKAIENKDIKQYLRLMHKKGLLENTDNDYNNILSIDEKRQLLQSIGITEISDVELRQSAVATVVWFFYIAVVAVSYVGFAYTAVATVNAAAGITIVAKAAAVVSTKVSGHSGHGGLVSKDFDIYLLSTEFQEINFNDENINKIVDDAIEVYKEIYLERAKQLDTTRLKQTINLNVSKQPVIAKNITIIEKDEDNL